MPNNRTPVLHRRGASTASTAKPSSLAGSTAAASTSMLDHQQQHQNQQQSPLVNFSSLSPASSFNIPAASSSQQQQRQQQRSTAKNPQRNNNNNNSVTATHQNQNQNSNQPQLPMFAATSTSSFSDFAASRSNTNNFNNNNNNNNNNNMIPMMSSTLLSGNFMNDDRDNGNQHHHQFSYTDSMGVAEGMGNQQEQTAKTNSSSYLFSPHEEDDEDDEENGFSQQKKRFRQLENDNNNKINKKRRNFDDDNDDNEDDESPNSFLRGGRGRRSNNNNNFDLSSGTQIGENGNFGSSRNFNNNDENEVSALTENSSSGHHTNMSSSLSSPIHSNDPNSPLFNNNNSSSSNENSPDNPNNNKKKSRKPLSFYFRRVSRACKSFLTFHRQLIYPSSTSPNAVNYCRSINLWSVLRLLPVWYQLFSALAVVIFILFFASQNSLIGVMLSALHVTFGMEALWPAVYQKHLANVTLNERLAFAGYAVFLSVCLFFYFKFITTPKLTKDFPLMKQLVRPEEKPLVNTRLVYLFVFLPAVAEAAMAVRGNMEDVFADMGDQHAAENTLNLNGMSSGDFAPLSSVNENSHWRLQSSALLWTIEYWKQTVVIPGIFCLAWRLVFDLTRKNSQTYYCSQRWNLVSFCAWRNIVCFIMFPNRFFCWVGAGGFLGFLAAFGSVNYCSASNPIVASMMSWANSTNNTSTSTRQNNNTVDQNDDVNKLSSASTTTTGRDQNITTATTDDQLDLASPSSMISSSSMSISRRANAPTSGIRASTVRFADDESNTNTMMNGFLSPSATSPSSSSMMQMQQNSNNISSPQRQQPTPYETRLYSEFSHAFSTREAIFLAITATMRSASIIPFLCIAVLTILAGVHVVELLGLWLCAFLFLIWSPAVFRSLSTDAMAMLSFAAASILMFWLEQLSLIDRENQQQFPPLEGYEKLRTTIVIAFALFCGSLATSSWTCVILSLPLKKFRIFRLRYKSVPVLMLAIWIAVCYLFVFGAVSPFRLFSPLYWLGYDDDYFEARQRQQLEQVQSWSQFMWEFVPFVSSSSSSTDSSSKEGNNKSTTNASDTQNKNESNKENQKQHEAASNQQQLQEQQLPSSSSSTTPPIVIITDEATRQVTRSVYASLRPILLGYDNVSTDFVYETVPAQFAGFPFRDVFVWVLRDDDNNNNPDGRILVTKDGEKRHKLFSLRWLLILCSNIMFGLSLVVSKSLIRFNERIVVQRKALIVEREIEAQAEFERRMREEEEEEMRLLQKAKEEEEEEEEERRRKQNKKEEENVDEELQEAEHGEEEKASDEKKTEETGKKKEAGATSEEKKASEQKEQKDETNTVKKKEETAKNAQNKKPRKGLSKILFGAEGLLTNYLLCDATIHLVRFSNIVDRLARTLSLLIFLTFCYRGSDWAAQYFAGTSSSSSSSSSDKKSSSSKSSSSSSSQKPSSKKPSSSSSSSSKSSSGHDHRSSVKSSSFSSSSWSSSSSSSAASFDFLSSYTTTFQFSAEVVRVLVQFLAFAFTLGGAIDMVEPMAKVFAKCMGSRGTQQQQTQQQQQNSRQQQRNTMSSSMMRSGGLMPTANNNNMTMMNQTDNGAGNNDNTTSDAFFDMSNSDNMDPSGSAFMMSPVSNMNLMSNRSAGATSSTSMQNNVNANSTRSTLSTSSNMNNSNINTNIPNSNNSAATTMMNNTNSIVSLSANTSFANTPSVRQQQQQDFSQGFVGSSSKQQKNDEDSRSSAAAGFLSNNHNRHRRSGGTPTVPLSSNLVSPSAQSTGSGW